MVLISFRHFVLIELFTIRKTIFSLVNLYNNKLKHIIMSYSFSKMVNYGFEEAIAKVTDELQKEGFGILTEIDMQAALKKKLNVHFRKYKILGACNPQFAFEALKREGDIGTMLPCNVVVQQGEGDKIKISIIDPVASMMAVKVDGMEELLFTVREKLKRVIEKV